MATYIQGVTDYIPEFQPFQPDLNFYNGLLATKQTQYDTNWKAINKIYGQYFYSDLSREDNIQIKDQLMKNIDFNLKRVSGLDLSLDQNVQQAVQVFKPFYEDQYLMKDMAYTKNYLNERNYGLSLKNSSKAEDRQRAWDVGIRALDYQREEFKNVSREESLNIASTSYTPYVNAIDKYGEIAKKWGISADYTLPDATGMYMIRQKNGDQIIPALETLFQAYGSNDPELQQVYFTQSYVNRKDYAYQNASKFNNDMNAAERDYLNTASKVVSDYVAKRSGEAEKQAEGIKNELNRTQKMVEKNEDNMFTSQYLQSLDEAAGYTEAVAESTQALNKDINNESVTAVTSGGSRDSEEDLETLRRKVDAGVAAMLMDADIAKAAYSYSRKDMIYDMKESQRGLEALRQQNRLAVVAAKQKADEWNIKLKNNLETGVWLQDEQGNVYPKDLTFFNPNPVSATDPDNPEGEDEEKKDINDENKYAMDEVARIYSKDWVESAHVLVEEAHKKGIISDAEYGKFFSLDWSENNYKTSAEAGRDIFNKASSGMTATGKGIIGKLVKGFGLDKRVEEILGKEASVAMVEWLKPKSSPKPKNYADKKNDSTITKIFDVLGVTKALGELYYKDPKAFLKDYQRDPASFLYGQAESLGLIKAKVDALAAKLRGDGSIGDNYIMNTMKSGMKMDEFIMHSSAVKLINDHNIDVIHKELMGNPKLYDIVKGDKAMLESLVNSFYDGDSIISKQDFKSLVRDQLNLEDKDYYITGKIASSRDFLNNDLTRGEIVESIFSKDSNLSKAQKYELVNKIMYAQSQAAKERQKAKKEGTRTGWDDEMVPVQSIVTNYLRSLNNSDSYASSIYDNLLATYTKTVKDPSKVQILTPLLSDVRTSGGRAGVYSKGESGVEVHLNAPATFRSFAEFVQGDLRNINLGDINNTAISIHGTTKSAFDKSKERAVEDGGATRDMLYRIINDAYAGISQKTGIKPFRFAQRQVAAENRNLGAMVMYFDKEFLDQYKAGKDEPGLSADDVNNMMRYGVSVIAPRQSFNNSLFTENFWTPMQIAVKSSPSKKVTLSNPYGAGKVELSEVGVGPGDYNITITTNEVKPDGTIKTRTTTLPNINYGNRLDPQARELMDQLLLVTAQNQNVFQGLSPENKRKVSQSGIFKDIPTAMIPLLQGTMDIKTIQYQNKNR